MAEFSGLRPPGLERFGKVRNADRVEDALEIV